MQSRQVLDPKTYLSPSGGCTLYIDPSEPQGSGGATYRVKKGSQLLWEGKSPFTLWDARIADDGTVGGYAFSKGIDGLGEFLVLLLDPAGKPLNEERAPRERSRYPDGPNTPQVNGLFLDPHNDRFVVRVADTDLNRGQEVWWCYSLRTGKKLPRFTPKQEHSKDGPSISLLHAEPVAGTPFILLHWWRVAFGKTTEQGAIFTLIDQNGKTLWRKELPHDYNIPGNEKEEERLRYEIWREGAFLPARAPRTFTLWHCAKKQAVTYTIAPATGAVQELGRTPFQRTPPKPITFSAPEVHPPLRDTLVLHAPAAGTPPPIRAILHPVPAGAGRLAFLRNEEPVALVVIRDQGTVVFTVPLKAIPRLVGDSFAALLWRGGNRFLVFVEHENAADPERCTDVYQVDAETDSVTPLWGFRVPRVRSLARTPEGGFVLLASVHWSSTITERLVAYGRQNKPLWTKGTDYGSRDTDGPEVLFSPEAVTVLRDGTVAVLDVIRHTVQLYNARGGFRKLVQLDKAWKRKAEYPSDIYSTPDGGFVVQDFPSTPSVYWMSTSGQLLRTLTPRHPGAKPQDPLTVFVDHDGHLWVNNTFSLFRLDTKGNADRRLGEAPRAEALREIIEMGIFDDGTILAADKRTNAVHVFDAKGKWCALASPSKTPAEHDDDFRSIHQQLECGPSKTFVSTSAGSRSLANPRQNPPATAPSESASRALPDARTTPG